MRLRYRPKQLVSSLPLSYVVWPILDQEAAISEGDIGRAQTTGASGRDEGVDSLEGRVDLDSDLVLAAEDSDDRDVLVESLVRLLFLKGRRAD